MSVDVFAAIRGRRSVGVVKDEPIAKEAIEQIVEAGIWAPSHHATEPWRFFVMTGEGRRVLARAYADIAWEQAQAAGGTADEQLVRSKAGGKAFRAPVVIAVAVSPSDSPQVIRVEEFAAVHAAVQNMLLAAHALGLGAIWRSGEPMYDARMQQAFGLKEGEQLVALLYIGVPQLPTPNKTRGAAQAKTVWIDSDN